MLKLVASDIHLNQNADNKEDAISAIGAALIQSGLVASGYEKGMQEREEQAATYLGNGVSIPHGVITTRHLVSQTGIVVFHFPKGVVWGDEGEKAYVAIGIAAKSDEHLTLLKQLTHVLSEDDIEERLQQINSKEDLIAILTGHSQTSSNILLSPDLFLWDVQADAISILQALNVSRLKRIEAITTDFITDIIQKTPYYLGQGIWLDDSAKGNKNNAIAICKPKRVFLEKEQPVKILITVTSIDNTFSLIIQKLASLLFTQNVDALLSYTPSEWISFLQTGEVVSSDKITENCTNNVVLKEEFILRNIHGLHTRPSSILAKIIKSYHSKVTACNLNNNPVKEINADSVMKLVSLGSKKGDRLQFTATGPDARRVLAAIEKAMEEEFGEGIE